MIFPFCCVKLDRMNFHPNRIPRNALKSVEMLFSIASADYGLGLSLGDIAYLFSKWFFSKALVLKSEVVAALAMLKNKEKHGLCDLSSFPAPARACASLLQKALELQAASAGARPSAARRPPADTHSHPGLPELAAGTAGVSSMTELWFHLRLSWSEMNSYYIFLLVVDIYFPFFRGKK